MYSKMAKIGSRLMGIGLTLTIVSSCVNTECNTDVAQRVLLTGSAVGIVLLLVGYALLNLREVEGHIFGAVLIMNAWAYQYLHLRTNLCRKCYRIVHKAGSYDLAYRNCYDKYIVQNG